MIICDS